jgi:hypothetical protein
LKFSCPPTIRAVKAFEPSRFTSLRSDLAQRFGGVTAFTRAPAQGVVGDGGKTVHYDIKRLER